VYGLLHAKDMADYKAVSSNLMHADITITDEIYAPLLAKEVKERIAAWGRIHQEEPIPSSKGFCKVFRSLN
jgi:hypothetical protein